MGETTGPRWRHGAIFSPSSTAFQLWAPLARRAQVVFEDRSPLLLDLHPVGEGYWRADAPVSAGTPYRFRVDEGDPWPDPASRHQPDGVHAASNVTNLSFAWTDQAWAAPRLQDYVIYELHVGTFTAEGTFQAAQERLPYLRDLGVTAVEIMPVAQFPGSRNWGYDGVYPFAVQDSYGGPAGLQRFVDACHGQGLAVVLDVVYNHLGPEGNYTTKFGPYFSDRYRTPWGNAINFDGEHSGGVRDFFVENAEYWIREFHVDALRLDAVHGIFDQSAYPILEEISDRVHQAGGLVIAESALNDPRLCLPKKAGLGLDAQWNDDFHHALRTLLTRDRSGYYVDFGTVQQLETAWRDGFTYQGQYSEFRKRRHGRCSRELDPSQLVVFSQNHDQVGNRMLGERPTAFLSFEEQKLAAGAVLLSPFLPLLFMGEEYGENAPFQYFVSHSDPVLVEAVRWGRKQEFKEFGWEGESPDPQAEETFQRSKLDWALMEREPHKTMLRFYRELLKLRRSLRGNTREVIATGSVLQERLNLQHGEASLWMNFGDARVEHPAEGRCVLDSAAAEWSGPGHSPGFLHPRAFVVFIKEP